LLAKDVICVFIDFSIGNKDVINKLINCQAKSQKQPINSVAFNEIQNKEIKEVF